MRAIKLCAKATIFATLDSTCLEEQAPGLQPPPAVIHNTGQGMVSILGGKVLTSHLSGCGFITFPIWQWTVFQKTITFAGWILSLYNLKWQTVCLKRYYIYPSNYHAGLRGYRKWCWNAMMNKENTFS